MQIIDALKKLDPKDDAHWTDDGAPRLDVVAQLMGVKQVTRKAIVEAAPKLDRSNLAFPGDPPPAAAPPTASDPSFVDQSGKPLAKAAEARDEDADAEQDEEQAAPPPEAEALLARARELETALAKEDEGLLEARARRERLADELNEVHGELSQIDGSASNQESIRAFIDSQNRLRLERHQRQQAVLGGVDMSRLNPKSPLDQALSRRPQRGGARPARQVST